MHDQQSSKIIVLGGRSAGKTALVIRCLTDQFFHHYISGSDTAYHYELNGNVMDIVDSTGRNEALISYADGIILVYSITDRISFLHLHTLIAKVRRLNLKPSTKIIIVGTKNDQQKERVISLYEGQEFAVDHNCLFFETSAKIPKQNVQDIFSSILLKTNSKFTSKLMHVGSKKSSSNNTTKKRRTSMSDSIKVQPHRLYDSVRNFVQKKRRESTGGAMHWHHTRQISRSMVYL